MLINPPSLRRANLLALRNAGIALGWSKSADSVIADANPSDLPASLSLASKVHLPSPEKSFYLCFMLTFTIYNTLVEIEILTSGFRSRQLHPRWLVQVQENRFRRPSGTEVDDPPRKGPHQSLLHASSKGLRRHPVGHWLRTSREI